MILQEDVLPAAHRRRLCCQRHRRDGAIERDGHGNATAKVIRPITLAASGDLAFGNVVPSAAGGTLALTRGTRRPLPTADGGITQPGTQTGTVTAAQFDVGGEGSFTYTITLPASAATITSASGRTR